MTDHEMSTAAMLLAVVALVVAGAALVVASSHRDIKPENIPAASPAPATSSAPRGTACVVCGRGGLLYAEMCQACELERQD